jgi:hypothetical protein
MVQYARLRAPFDNLNDMDSPGPSGLLFFRQCDGRRLWRELHPGQYRLAALFSEVALSATATGGSSSRANGAAATVESTAA